MDLGAGFMDKKFLFTHERLSKLHVPETGRVEYFDTKQQKLRLRITSTGLISFAVVKRFNDKPKRVTIGSWPEVTIAKAREEAIQILDKMRQGIDPVADKRKQQRESTTLVDVLEQYLTERDLRLSTIEDYRYKLKNGFNDWLNKPVSNITEGLILKRQKEISQKKGNTTANTTMRVLRAILNYAEAVGMLENNPASILRKARLWHKNKRKNRLIPVEKLRLWHEAVDDLPNQKAKVYLFMALYMGFRSTELLTLEWAHVDMTAKRITLLDTKNRTDHQLPIPTILVPHINNLREITGESKWCFEGSKPGKPMTTPIKPIKNVIEASGVEFSPHDVRRTFATIAEAVHLPWSMIQRLLNHVTTNDVTGGYIVTEEETLRQAINKIASYIQARVSQQDNVIKLQG